MTVNQYTDYISPSFLSDLMFRIIWKLVGIQKAPILDLLFLPIFNRPLFPKHELPQQCPPPHFSTGKKLLPQHYTHKDIYVSNQLRAREATETSSLRFTQNKPFSSNLLLHVHCLLWNAVCRKVVCRTRNLHFQLRPESLSLHSSLAELGASYLPLSICYFLNATARREIKKKK